MASQLLWESKGIIDKPQCRFHFIFSKINLFM